MVNVVAGLEEIFTSETGPRSVETTPSNSKYCKHVCVQRHRYNNSLTAARTRRRCVFAFVCKNSPSVRRFFFFFLNESTRKDTLSYRFFVAADQEKCRRCPFPVSRVVHTCNVCWNASEPGPLANIPVNGFFQTRIGNTVQQQVERVWVFYANTVPYLFELSREDFHRRPGGK